MIIDGTFDNIFNEWINYSIEKIIFDEVPFVINDLKLKISALPSEHITVYATYFDSFSMLLFVISFCILLYYIGLIIFKNVQPNYVKQLSYLIEEIKSSSFLYKEIDEKLYNAHLVILKKLITLSKMNFLEFYDHGKFNDIAFELKLFYSLVKTVNKRQFLLNINTVQRMFVSIVLTNKYKLNSKQC